MMVFKEFSQSMAPLLEAKASKGGDKNLHLDHAEDMLFLYGVNGFKRVMVFLKDLAGMLSGKTDTKVAARTTRKFDGAPAIFCGINPDNGKFFVGPKAVFSQAAKICYTEEDIDKYFPTATGLNAKLKIALRYLPKLEIKDVLQGDILFTDENKKIETIEGKKYLVFRPNTITYSVPYGSDLARKIMDAKIGVVFHTLYTGSSFAQMKASFRVSIHELKKTPDVWFRDAYFNDLSGLVSFTDAETKRVNDLIKSINSYMSKVDPKIINKIAENEFLRVPLLAWNNLKVRQGESITNIPQHIQGFIISMDQRLNQGILDAKKEDTKKKRLLEKNNTMRFLKARGTIETLTAAFQIFNLITELKLLYISKLRQIQDSLGTFIKTTNGYKVTEHEGFVAIDHAGSSAIKLIDRLEFSRQNFTVPKDWDTQLAK